MTVIKNPEILYNIFDEKDYNILKEYLFSKTKTENNYNKDFGRYDFNDDLIDKYCERLIPIARKHFNSKTLTPSYSLFAHYQGENASLPKHLDDNACTYTIDLCLYQSETWDIWVDEKPYTLQEGDALAYYGNDQEHFRKKFPNPKYGYTGMVFFHFVEPEHWWIKKGPSYIDVIRGYLTEDQWVIEQNYKKYLKSINKDKDNNES